MQSTKKATIVRIQAQVIKDARKKAIDMGISYSEFVEQAIREFISKN